MPKVQLKIEVNDNAESEKLGDITNQVNGEGSNANLSNVSIEANNNGIYIIGAMNKNGREMLSFGEDGNLVFNIDGFLSSNGVKAGALASEQDPDMFVWGVVPASKEYHVKLTFINAKNLREIVVYGDPVANQFPTEAIVNGTTTIYSDDNRWAINLGSESTTHTIEFTKWNRADYNACLTIIKVMLRYFEIGNHTGLLDVESLSQSNSQPKEIMYGVVPSTGTARINVFDELRDLIEEGIITSNKNAVEIYVDGRKVQHHITTDSDYENNRVLTMDFENRLSFLDGVYAGRNLTDPMNAYDLLSEVLGTLGFNSNQVDSMLDKEIVYGNDEFGNIKSYLEKITIEYPYLESATYRETLDKFCVLAQLNLLEDDNGDLKFVSARPIEPKHSETIVIPVNRQFSTFSKDEFVKNKYVNPFVQYCKFVSGNNLFGDTTSVSYLEDNGKLDEGYLTVAGQSTFATPVTLYDVSANDVNKNSLSNFTTIEDETFKTSVAIKIPKETIIKDISTIKLSLSGNKAGTNTQFYTDSDGVMKPYNYLPYKTSSFNAILELDNNLASTFSTISVSNVDKSKEQIKFDISFSKPPTKMKYIGSSSQYEVPYFLSGTFQLYGETYSYNILNNENNSDIEISGNELVQEGTIYNGIRKVYELNKNNIASDYGNGIRTSKLSVACLDYYNTKGELAIDWSKQEIFKVGDVVRVDKDNVGNSIANYSNGEPYLWKITGRNFRYSGVPMLDLELQEVKLVEPRENLDKYYISATIGTGARLILERVSSPYGNAHLGEVSVDDTFYYGDKVNVSWELESGYTAEVFLNGTQIFSHNLNQITITSNNDIIINTTSSGWRTIFEGDFTYYFDNVNSQNQIAFPVDLRTTQTKFTFEWLNMSVGNNLANGDIFANEVSSSLVGLDRQPIYASEYINGNFYEHENPSITFNFSSDNPNNISKFINVVRTMGIFGGYQAIVSGFKITKIEQYY